MSVTVTQPSINIREELANLPKQQVLRAFFFTGVTAQNTFVMLEGWKPIQVFDTGSLQREGASEAYILTVQTNLYSIVFDTSPAEGTNIDVLAEMV